MTAAPDVGLVADRVRGGDRVLDLLRRIGRGGRAAVGVQRRGVAARRRDRRGGRRDVGGSGRRRLGGGLGLAALRGCDAALEVALTGGQLLQRLAAGGAGRVELLLLGLERGTLVGELLVAGGEVVTGGRDPVLGVGEAGNGRLDLVAEVLDPGDRVLLVLVDAVEVGGIDRGVLPAQDSIRSLIMSGSSDL